MEYVYVLLGQSDITDDPDCLQLEGVDCYVYRSLSAAKGAAQQRVNEHCEEPDELRWTDSPDCSSAHTIMGGEFLEIRRCAVE